MASKPIVVSIQGDDRQVNEVLGRALARIRQLQDGSEQAGRTIENSFGKGRAAIALFNSELGIGMDRHLRAVIASCEMLGPAFQVAFPIAVVTGFAVVAAKLVEHFKSLASTEWSKKTQEALSQLAQQAVESDRTLQLSGKTEEQQAMLRMRWAAQDAGQLKEYMALRQKQLEQAEHPVTERRVTSYVRGMPVYQDVIPITKGDYDLGPVVPSAKALREELAKLPLELYLADNAAKSAKATFAALVSRDAIKDMSEYSEKFDKLLHASKESIAKAEGEDPLDREIRKIKEEIEGWETLTAQRKGINATANEYIEKLTHELAILKEQEAASIRMALLRDKAADKMLGEALSTPTSVGAVYSGTKLDMERYNISVKNNDAIRLRDSLMQTLLPTEEKYKTIEAELVALKHEHLVTDQQFNEAMAEARLKYDAVGKAMGELGQKAGQALAQMVLMGASWQQVMRSLSVTILEVIVQMTVLSRLKDSAFGSTGFGSFLTSVMKGFSGGHAGGGSVGPGMWGIAGENGPEPIFGGAVGLSVFPNRSMGGHVTYNIDNRGASVDAIARLERLFPVFEERAVRRSVAVQQEIQARR